MIHGESELEGSEDDVQRNPMQNMRASWLPWEIPRNVSTNLTVKGRSKGNSSGKTGGESEKMWKIKALRNLQMQVEL